MDENEVGFKTTMLLIEHFGYQPISVIDDIINVINEIMYRCTEQLEQTLINQKVSIDKRLEQEKRQRKEREIKDDIIVDMNNDDEKSNSNSKSKYSIEDIQVGTATLESFLEHTINKNFDKFEVYSLRNVFKLPEDLVVGGYVRLKHHEGLYVVNNVDEKDKELTERLLETVNKIKYQTELNKLLSESLKKYQTLLKMSKFIKSKLNSLIAGNDTSIENKKLIATITPLSDTLLYLITQIRNMNNKVNELKNSVNDDTLRLSILKESKEEQELNIRINEMVERILKKPPTLSTLADVDDAKARELVGFFTSGTK